MNKLKGLDRYNTDSPYYHYGKVIPRAVLVYGHIGTVFYSGQAIDEETLVLTYDELSKPQLEQLVAAAGENMFTFYWTS